MTFPEGDMTTTLILPDRVAPTNLHLRASVKTRFIDSDLYQIADRIKAIDPRLYVIQMEEGDQFAWAIMEHCIDGVDRLVFRTDALDGRVVGKLQYLMAMPLQGRLDTIEREDYKFEADRKEAELEELYENLGKPMWSQLDHDGFIDRPVSYPKRGVTGGRGSLK